MNEAQRIHELLGLAVATGPQKRVANGNKNASATKAGPGRFHRDGHEKNAPIKPSGASGFALHKASTEKQERRNTMAAVGGRRQYLKKMKQALRDQKAAIAAGWEAARKTEAIPA